MSEGEGENRQELKTKKNESFHIPLDTFPSADLQL